MSQNLITNQFIEVFNSINKNKPTKFHGKWISILGETYANNVWEKVKKATEEGKLGYKTRVYFPFLKDSKSSRKFVSICFYTYDCRDFRDVMKIREELKKLGFIHPLRYRSKLLIYE